MPSTTQLTEGLNKVTRNKIKGWKIRVTQDNIDRSKPNTQAWCMVSLAIRECIEGSHTIRVDSSFIRFSIGIAGEGGLRYAYPTPMVAVAPIQVYDHEAEQKLPSTVKPFEFSLQAVQAYVSPMLKHSSPEEPRPRGPNNPKARCKKYRWNGQPILK
jgi:hypothetical protein